MVTIFPSTISRRLASAFGALLALFGVATYVALSGLSESQTLMRALRDHDFAARAALLLANAIREQYLPLPSSRSATLTPEARLQARDVAPTLIGRIREQAIQAEELGWVDEIDRARLELETAPASPGGGTASSFVSQRLALIDDRALRLSRSFETTIGILDAKTAVVQRTTHRRMLWMLLSSVLFAISLGLYVGGAIARPMSLLEEGAIRLASGDLSTRIELNSPDEFGRLANQFNRMTVTLKEHQMKLLQSERLAVIGRFAAGVAHEINNPLGVILGYVRVNRKSADPRLDDDLRIIEEEAVRCQEIVEGLLDLARPAKSTRESADLREIADEAVSWLRGASHLGDIAVTVDGSGVVAGNSQKLWQVLTNLLKNAAEASGPGGRVGVRIQHAPPGQIALSVTDSGPGLPAEAPERLFEPFYTTKASGTGLGLAVSWAIVQSSGGTLLAETSPVGGAVFTVRLPEWVAEAA